jgi:hypothetical protein
LLETPEAVDSCNHCWHVTGGQVVDVNSCAGSFLQSFNDAWLRLCRLGFSCSSYNGHGIHRDSRRRELLMR